MKYKPESEWKKEGSNGRILICIADGCNERAISEGLCLKHLSISAKEEEDL